MRVDAGGAVPLWRFDLGGDAAPGGPLLAAVTTRHGGASSAPYDSLNLAFHVGDDPAAVLANRDAVAATVAGALGLPLASPLRLTVADQQHGSRVAVVDDAVAGAGHAGLEDAVATFPATDALVTAVPGAVLAVCVADCAPVVLWDAAHRAVGVVHSGRPGAVLDVIGAAVRAMADAFGTRPGELRAGVGPCIAGPSYEVGPSEGAAVAAAFPAHPELLVPTQGGRATFDLPGAVRVRLREAGIPDDAVESAGVDTRRATATFFSDRAARPCGRFALVAAVRPDR